MPRPLLLHSTCHSTRQPMPQGRCVVCVAVFVLWLPSGKTVPSWLLASGSEVQCDAAAVLAAAISPPLAPPPLPNPPRRLVWT